MSWIKWNIFYPIKKFFAIIKNVLSYFPLLWEDRQWDYGFMLEMERKKLQKMIKWYEENDYGHLTSGYRTYRTMKLALGCLNIILEDDWWSIKVIPITEWSKMTQEEINSCYNIKPYINVNNRNRFLHVNCSKDDKGYWIDLREEKAWRLYNKIREQYMRTWWD